jgi:hypothetical protein
VRNVNCHIATDRYHLMNIKHDVDNSGSVVERRVGLMESWVCIPFEASTSGCDEETPVKMA